MRVVILGSGRGSNAEALCIAQREGRLGRAEIVAIFSDRPEAGILGLGPRFGIEARHLDAAPFKTKLEGEGEARYIAAVQACAPDLVVLAGFMRVLTEWFINRWTGRLINIHPALLPSFKGLHTHERALAEGVKIHGCTVHHVVPDVDAGPIIAQAAVPVLDDDTADSLGARVLEAEHQLYPMALALLVSGQTLKKPAGSHSPDQPMLIMPDGA
jgi:phosphoribosylglycinamide formyltransferase-1